MAEFEAGGWLARRRRYRWLSYLMIVTGILGLGVGSSIGVPILGISVYWLGFVGFFAVRRWAPMDLFDERDCALERQASYDTLRLAGLALVVVAPAATTLDDLGYYDIPSVVDGALWGYAGLFLIFGLAYVGRRYRP